MRLCQGKASTLPHFPPLHALVYAMRGRIARTNFLFFCGKSARFSSKKGRICYSKRMFQQLCQKKPPDAQHVVRQTDKNTKYGFVGAIAQEKRRNFGNMYKNERSISLWIVPPPGPAGTGASPWRRPGTGPGSPGPPPGPAGWLPRYGAGRRRCTRWRR